MSTIWGVRDPNICVLLPLTSGTIACHIISGSELFTIAAWITSELTDCPGFSRTTMTIIYLLHGSQFSILTLISVLKLTYLLLDYITTSHVFLPVFPILMLSLLMLSLFLGLIMFTSFLLSSFYAELCLSLFQMIAL